MTHDYDDYIRNTNSGNIIGLFGTELSLRCDWEKRVVPSIVSRCIEEVETRGKPPCSATTALMSGPHVASTRC